MTDALPVGRDVRGGEPDFGSPYFFVSYAPTVRPGSRGGISGSWVAGPDESVTAFFHDLSENVRMLIGAAPGTAVGYLPVPEPGEPWPGAAAQPALASAKIFVPLYCDRYFNNKQCGRQWSVFWARAAARGASGQHAIVPALWRRVGSDPLPEPAARLNFDHVAFGHSYAVFGLSSIMKLSRYRDDYQHAVYEIAQRIVNAARITDLPTAEPVDLDAAPDAFEDRPSSRRLHVTFVAPTLAELPAHRNRSYYGRGPLDWSPYRPTSAAPLADHVENLVRNLDFQPDTRAFEEARKDLLAGGAPTGPGLLIVDVWALRDEHRRSLLARFDTLDKPWIGVLVPWNTADEETLRAEESLRAHLDQALHRKLAEGRVASRTAVHGIPTLAEFDRALIDVLDSVKRYYLRHALAFPPPGSAIGKPHVSIPDSQRADGRPEGEEPG
jgi:FxsC-like protein